MESHSQLRAVPHVPGEWSRIVDLVTGALFGLAEEQRSTGAVPDVLDNGRALRSWSRVATALVPVLQSGPAGRFLSPRLDFVAVDPADVAALGDLARRLGRCLLPGMENDPPRARLTIALDRAACAAVTTPAEIVLQLARVHGVLDLPLGGDGEILHRWGADGPLFTRPPGSAIGAHRRIAARVYAMWVAGAPLSSDPSGSERPVTGT